MRVHSVFRSERLSVNTILNLHKAQIPCIMIYVCPTWLSAADSHVLKLQRLRNRILRTTDNFSKRTPTRDLHVLAAFKIPYLYDFIIQLWRQQTEVIQYSLLGRTAASIRLNTTFRGLAPSPSSGKSDFRRMGTELVPETLYSNELTRLCAREDYIVLLYY
jgi:hypothetical protein